MTSASVRLQDKGMNRQREYGVHLASKCLWTIGLRHLVKQLATVSDFLTHTKYLEGGVVFRSKPLFDVLKTFDAQTNEKQKAKFGIKRSPRRKAIVRSRALIRNPEQRGQFRGIRRNSHRSRRKRAKEALVIEAMGKTRGLSKLKR